MDTSLFTNLGMTNAETKVYLALVQVGLTTTGKLIKQSGLQKSTVYAALETLQQEGYVRTSVRNHVQYFMAEDPNIMTQKVQLMQDQCQKTVTELNALKKQGTEEHVQSMIYEGFKAVVSSLQHRLTIVKNGEEILIFGSFAANPETKAAVFALQNVNREAAKKGIKIRVLFNKQMNKTTLAQFYERLKNTTVKYIHETTPVGIAVYHDFIYTLVWTDTRNPTAVLTQSKTIAAMYRSFFEGLWKAD